MESSRPVAYRTDLRLIPGDQHPLVRIAEKRQYELLQKILNNERRGFGAADHISLARTDAGQTPLMLLFCNYSKTPQKKSQKALRILLESFKLDPDVADSAGRTALMYALLYRADLECIKLLLKNGADPKLTDHNQLSALIYAAGLLRLDVIRIICPDYRATTTEALQMKFVNLDMWSEKLRASPRNDKLELPAQMEGSPKRSVVADMSPVSLTPINGIRFRLSPSSPASSSPLSMAVHQPRSSTGTRRTSEDKTTNTSSTSKSGPLDILNYPKLLRRVCSATFDSRFHKGKCGVFEFAQLTHNLCVYLEETDYPYDKTPEPLESERDDLLGEIAEENAEKEPRRVSLPTASAPILIKSRSVEDSISRSPHDFSAVLIRALPREHRKNALASGHLIERQGSAPQLQLKRRPRGMNSAESSSSTSPVTGLSRNPTRQQIASPLANMSGPK